MYRTSLKNQLSQAQYKTLEILVWLLQVHKQVKIERLATHFPLPILMESRRRHIQRFLLLTALSIPIVWFPIIEAVIQLKIKLGTRLYIAIDRTQWKDKNLFVAAAIIERRALPIYWQFLDKRGASNLAEQQALLRPVFKLLKKYELVVYRGKVEKEPWYLLTNFCTLEETLKAYKKRTGIEAMFKDCKTGGYNLEGSKAPIERLTRLVLLIAIAYTFSTLKGQVIKSTRQQKYIGRLRKIKQSLTKNSNFWLGLYGDVWIIAREFVGQWVEELMKVNLNKLPFYQKGIRAMNIIQQAF